MGFTCKINVRKKKLGPLKVAPKKLTLADVVKSETPSFAISSERMHLTSSGEKTPRFDLSSVVLKNEESNERYRHSP